MHFVVSLAADWRDHRLLCAAGPPCAFLHWLKVLLLEGGQGKQAQDGGVSTYPTSQVLGIDSPLFSTIVHFKTGRLGFLRGFRKIRILGNHGEGTPRLVSLLCTWMLSFCRCRSSWFLEAFRSRGFALIKSSTFAGLLKIYMLPI